MLNNFWSRLQGNRTYIFATFMTGLSLYALVTGKADFTTAAGMIMTAGLGACLRSGINTRAEPGFGCDGDQH